MNRKIVIPMLSLLLSFGLQAQDVSVKSKIDNNVINIGQQSNLSMSVSAPPEVVVAWPVIPDTLITEIEVVKKSEVDTNIANGMMNYSQNLVITSFDSGYYAIPPFVFKAMMPDGSVKTFETDAVLYEVHTVAVDTTAAIKDIKPIASVPLTFREMVPYIMLGIIVIALLTGLFFLIKYLRKKSKSSTGTSAQQIYIPPHTAALNSLFALEQEKLWQSGEIKEYYFRITSILREYISRQYDIDAVEMVTDDIFDELSKSDKCQSDDVTLCNGIFVLSDLVKFAKYQPEMDENVNVIKNAYLFVNNTHQHLQELKRIEEEKKRNDLVEKGGEDVQ